MSSKWPGQIPTAHNRRTRAYPSNEGDGIMARKIVEEKVITNSEAKAVLEKVKEEELGEFQRRTLDFTRRFTKLPAERASKLVEELSSKLQLDRNDAIQIVNTLPQSVEELRAVLTVKGRFVSTEQLNGILEIMKRYT